MSGHGHALDRIPNGGMNLRGVAALLLPWPLTALVLSLMSVHMKYHDIGINPAANNGFLLFFVAPALLAALYLAALLARSAVARRPGSPWGGVALGAAMQGLVAAAAFAAHVWRYAGYPSEHPHDLLAFLGYWVGHLGRP